MMANQPIDPAALDFANLTEEEIIRIREQLEVNRALLNNNNRMPHVPSFNGEQKGYDFAYWRDLVFGLVPTYSEASIIQAIRKSITGQPAQIIGTLGVNCRLTDILGALDTAYGHVHDTAAAWQQFYNAKQKPNETVVEWHTRISNIWSQIPNHGDVELHIKKRLWDGLYSAHMKESARHKYDDDTVTPDAFMRYLRNLEPSKNTKGCNAAQPEALDKVITQLNNLSTKVDNVLNKTETSTTSPEMTQDMYEEQCTEYDSIQAAVNYDRWQQKNPHYQPRYQNNSHRPNIQTHQHYAPRPYNGPVRNSMPRQPMFRHQHQEQLYNYNDMNNYHHQYNQFPQHRYDGQHEQQMYNSFQPYNMRPEYNMMYRPRFENMPFTPRQNMSQPRPTSQGTNPQMGYSSEPRSRFPSNNQGN